MNYWRFRSILNTKAKINAISSGQIRVESGLPQSSKDMIERRKAQR